MHNLTDDINSAEEHWISISDMMSGLMMVFIFISVIYMIQIFKDKAKIEKIAITYDKMQTQLYEELENEFREDLKKWNAEIERSTLSIRFKEPDILFEQGSILVKPLFKDILRDFIPRYLRILSSEKYKQDIEEIRVEGHTSSEWRYDVSADMAYINNMELSQGRTRSVLEYILNIEDVSSYKDLEWLKSHLTANGLSSSKLVLRDDGSENRQESRRVEFRVRTNAEKRIVEIINREDGTI